MQQKINYLIWVVVVLLIIFFGSLAIINKNKIKEFKYTKISPYNIDIRIYHRSVSKGNNLINGVKNIKTSRDQKAYMSKIITYMDDKKINKYLIQVDNDVLVGNSYSRDKYKVATYYSDNTLFKIIDTENEYVLTEDYDCTDYDRIIMIGPFENVNKLDNYFKKNMGIANQKEVASQVKEVNIYWLKGHTLITSLNS